MPRAESHHHLVIVRRDADGDVSVLLLDGPEGPTLPRIVSEERRSADVADLAGAVRAALGLEVSVLRCLSDHPARDQQPRRHLYLLEAHRGNDRAPGRWIPRGALAAAVPSRAPARAALDEWRRVAGTTAALDWAQPGWRDGVVTWIDAQLSRVGFGPVAGIEQIRVWETSQVLRVDTGAGRFYFKARPPSGAVEPQLTEHLARRHPAFMPGVIAVDAERRWLLMREAPGRELMEVSDLTEWEAVARAIARMQIDWSSSIIELAALGCPRLTLAALEAEVKPLLEDVRALQPGGEDSLTDAEVATLQSRESDLEALCRELAAAGVPDSLEHGDLWAANAIVATGALALLDWEDASIAHPFFTPSLLLLSIPHAPGLTDHAEARRRITQAYLAPWAEHGSLPLRELERVFELAQQVAMLHYALQFRRFAAAIETSVELRGFLPFFLGRLVGR